MELWLNNKWNQEKKGLIWKKSFKSSECVICLIIPPNVLFCNCGHIPVCVECDEVKGLDVWPICKTENYIKRMVE